MSRGSTPPSERIVRGRKHEVRDVLISSPRRSRGGALEDWREKTHASKSLGISIYFEETVFEWGFLIRIQEPENLYSSLNEIKTSLEITPIFIH
jgi:hypothetical protein